MDPRDKMVSEELKELLVKGDLGGTWDRKEKEESPEYLELKEFVEHLEMWYETLGFLLWFNLFLVNRTLMSSSAIQVQS